MLKPQQKCPVISVCPLAKPDTVQSSSCDQTIVIGEQVMSYLVVTLTVSNLDEGDQ